MQEDFHYYATYCAAYLAGYSHEESLDICYSAQFVDCCSKTLISKLKGPASAATTQLQLEMMDMRTDTIGLQEITRIWSSFHFLPRDLYADSGCRSKRYNSKYRLICGPNGALIGDTVNTAKSIHSLQAVGIAMHVLADTWAHAYFAGTPSFVINNTDGWFYELLPGDGEADFIKRQVRFRHSVTSPDDLETSTYTNSVYQLSETSIMNLGHGRAGHLPDYSFIRYKYMPAWGNYGEILKDNPSDYYKAFSQMVYALKFLRNSDDAIISTSESRSHSGSSADSCNTGSDKGNTCFAGDTYDVESVEPYAQEIRDIISCRQLNACNDWKAFGEKLSGKTIEDFDIHRYESEYIEASAKSRDKTFLGRFFIAAMAQKSLITNRIYSSGNMLAGFSVDFDKKGFRGIRDFRKLVNDGGDRE